MVLRGASEKEVITTIHTGAPAPAKQGRLGIRLDFPFGSLWGGRHYATKQVLAIVVDEPADVVVVTVHAFYF